MVNFMHTSNFSSACRRMLLISLVLIVPAVTPAANAATDVSVDSVDAVDGAYQVGTTFDASARLTNNGTSASGAFNISFYLSPDATVTTGDTLLVTQSVDSMAAGAGADVAATLTVPANLEAGDYYIGAVIDLDDSNTANNSGADATAIFVYVNFLINTGLNDAWSNPVTDGQGFFITVFPNLNAISLAWFTYDTEQPPIDATANLGSPGHRWLTAFGLINGNRSDMDITITTGGLFDDPTEVNRAPDGTISLEFSSCKRGTAAYDIPSIDATGVVPIQRVAGDNIKLCEALLREQTLNPNP